MTVIQQEYASKYYRKNKSHYRTLHKQYKEELSDSYVRRQLGKKSDVPDKIVKAKRQYMKMNRQLKEN